MLFKETVLNTKPMKRKLVFYALLFGILGLTVFLSVGLFVPTEEAYSSKNSKRDSKTIEAKVSSSRGRLPSSQPGDSIWTDDSTWNAKLDVDELKTSAEITQAKNLLIELYKLPDKESFLQKALELREQYPTAAEFPAALADYYYNKGDLIHAELYLKETLERAPDYVFGRNSLADIYVKQGRFEEAQKTYAQVFENVDNLYAYQGYLGVSSLIGQVEEAKQKLIQMQKNHPEKTNLALSVADIYFIDGDIQARDQLLQETYKRDPSHPILNQVLANDAMLKGDFKAVLFHGQRAVDNEVNQRRKLSMLETMKEVAIELEDQQELARIQQQISEVRNGHL